MRRCLVVDDDDSLRFAFQRLLDPAHYEIVEAPDGERGLALLEAEPFHLVFLDLRMPGLSGMETLSRIHAEHPKIPVIIMTAYGTMETAIEAVQRGAHDFVLKPFEIGEIQAVADAAYNAHRLMARPVGFSAVSEPAAEAADSIIGQSKPMQEVYKDIGLVAESDATVLVLGESGTGKELVARAIYHHSARSDQPFLAVNCAAIPEGLLESELFGHERGAFTSADRARVGKFEQVHRGTLFLDEIGDMSSATQAKILRVLQDGVIMRVGGTAPVHVDVRIIAATNRDLARMVNEGGFREDLYFRMNVFEIRLPPLRHRPEDIGVLTDYFIARGNADYGKSVTTIADEARRRLRDYSWPGNVRELENVIRRALIVTTGNVLLPGSLTFRREVAGVGSSPAAVATPQTLEEAARAVFDLASASEEPDEAARLLPKLERIYVEMALVHFGGNQVQAAKFLGMSRQTLRNRIAEWELGDRPGELGGTSAR